MASSDSDGFSDDERERLSRSEFAVCVGTFYREIAEHGLADSVFLQHDLEQREEVARL